MQQFHGALYVQQGLVIVASGSHAARKCGCSPFSARVRQSRVSFHSLWDSRRFESAKIALNAGKQSGLTEGYSTITRLSDIAQSTVSVTRACERRAERISISGGVFILRFDRFFQFPNSFLVLLLVHQDAPKMEVCLIIVGVVFDGSSVLS